jgi:hypothetical protein
MSIKMLRILPSRITILYCFQQRYMFLPLVWAETCRYQQNIVMIYSYTHNIIEMQRHNWMNLFKIVRVLVIKAYVEVEV